MPSDSKDKSLALIPQEVSVEVFKYDFIKDAAQAARAVFLSAEIDAAIEDHGKNLFVIGDGLIEMKSLLGNKHFSQWYRVKHGQGIRTAQILMQTAEAFEKTNRGSLFGKIGIRALQILSGKDVPEEARKAVIDIAGSGRHVSIKEAKQIASEAKGEPTPPSAPTVRRTCKVCGDPLPSERVGFICSGCMNAGAGASSKPHTVQPNMPRTDRDDSEPGRSSVGRTFTPAADSNIGRGVFGREVKEYILGKIKLCKQAGTGIHEALDAWEEELRG